MGNPKRKKISRTNIEIVKTLACLKNIQYVYQKRYNDFIDDFGNALTIISKEDRLYSLERLNDELNGYIAKIDHNINIANMEYNIKYPSSIKDLKDLRKAYEENIDNDDLKKITKKLNEARNRVCHPDPYHFSTVLFFDKEEIKEVIEKSIEKLEKLAISNDFIIKRECQIQESNRERKVTNTLEPKTKIKFERITNF